MTDSKTSLFDKAFLFFKAQCSAGCGTVVDYGTMLLLTEVFGIHYAYSIMIGGVFGALVNFLINMRWTFRGDNAYKSSMTTQMIKFAVVAVNSILLKSGGTHLLTTLTHIDYKFTRLVVDVIVSVLFNYTLQKNWVFKKEEIKK